MEGRQSSCVGLVFDPPPALPLQPFCAHLCGWVAVVKSLPGDEHIPHETSRLGTVPLLQDHYHVLHAAMQEVDPESGPS